MSIKQVICIRNDLNMRKGKMVSQGAHASCAWLTNRLNPVDLGQTITGVIHTVHLTLTEMDWLKGLQTKICVQVNSEAELIAVYNEAKGLGLECHMIIDAGLTEFNGVPTKTCLAIGPDLATKIDPITSHLVLL